MSHSSALREPRQSPSYAPVQHQTAMHARIVQAMPDLDAAAVDRLAGICAELPPVSQPAANASLDPAAVRYYASRRGLAGLVNGEFQDRQRDLSMMDWLLLSIRMAAKDGGSEDWVIALADLGSGWITAQQHELSSFQPCMQAALEAVDREEGAA